MSSLASPRSRLRPLVALVVPVLAASLALTVLAPAQLAHAETPAAVKKAGKHFQRGVALYNETDYRAALVEFRRAYETAPNPAVLYNIGQTYYQLQSYAQALTTFERYLAESGDVATHKKEVDDTVEILRSRVGKLQLAVNLDGCEVSVDDELAGKTPIGEPVLVSIGRRKVIAMCEGRPAETRIVEVAAGDVLEVKIFLAPNATPAAALRGGSSSKTPPTDWRKIGWITTGALAVGTVATGVFTLLAYKDLSDERDTYPSSLNKLDDKASKLRKLSFATDILGAATLVVGGITLTYALTNPRAREKVQLSVAPNGMTLSGTFE
jgi:tetratricopeptide (TPR) repeat protein